MAETTKKCRECKEEIPADAKKCGKCGAKQGNWAVRHPVWTAIIVIIILCIIGSAASGNKSGNTGSSTGNTSQTQVSSENSDNQTSTEAETTITYTTVTKDELDEDLENNAAAAKDKWNKQYVEVSGKLATIDSDLKYITLESATKQYDLQTIRCRIKTDEQKDKVKTLSKGQDLTIRGQITDVGEFMGYSLDITEIE